MCRDCISSMEDVVFYVPIGIVAVCGRLSCGTRRNRRRNNVKETHDSRLIWKKVLDFVLSRPTLLLRGAFSRKNML